MRSDLIVIGSVLLEHATPMGFVEHDQVVEGFASNRAYEALDVAVLRWRAWRGRMIANPHCPNAAGIGWAEVAITVCSGTLRSY